MRAQVVTEMPASVWLDARVRKRRRTQWSTSSMFWLLGVAWVATIRSASAAPCPGGSMLQEFFVSSSQEAVLLRDAIACEGGNFLARWQGSVSIDGWGSGFVLGLGTKLLVVGEGEDAEILGAVLGSKAGNAGLRGASVLPSRFFTVTGLATSLDLQNLKLVGGIAPSVAGNTFAAMGGAIAVSEGASATIQKSAFINNYAYDSGGAVAIMGVRTDVTITNTTFSGNSAARMNGGALYIDLGASLIMTSCLVSNSIAQRDGGALAAMRGSTVLVKSTTFSENIARSGEGGGIHAVDGVMLSLIESSIERNTASTIAGGIRVAAGSNASLTDCTLIDNSVVSGEGPSASISDSRADFLSVALADSSGSDSRFAVHLQVESIFLCELCTFRGWAGKQVILSETSAITLDYPAFEAAVGVTLLSAEPPKLPSEQAAVIRNANIGGELYSTSTVPIFAPTGVVATCSSQIDICKVAGSPSSCIDGSFGVLCECAGKTCFQDLGVATLTQVAAAQLKVASSGGKPVVWSIASESGDWGFVPSSGVLSSSISSAGVKILPTVGGGAGISPSSDFILTLHTLQVHSSDILPDGSTLLMDADARQELIVRAPSAICAAGLVHDGTACLSCSDVVGEGAICLETGLTLASLPLSPGYWRPSLQSREIVTCAYEESCLGGSAVEDSDEYCAPGYEGTWCGQCKAGFAPAAQGMCFACTLGVKAFTALAWVTAVVVALYFVLMGYSVQLATLIQAKTVILCWQVLSQFTIASGLQLPAAYKGFIAFLAAVNFDIGFLVNASCTGIHLNFYARLVLVTAVPLISVSMLLALYWWSCRSSEGKPAAAAPASMPYAVGAIAITTLMYTTVSTVLFQTYQCVDLEGGASYLKADASISCNNSMHSAFKIYAGFMIGIFVMGIPSLYAWLLLSVPRHQNSPSRMPAQEAVPDQQPAGTIALDGCNLLKLEYREGCSALEPLQLLRRLVLTSVLLFVAPSDSSNRALFACSMAMLFLLCDLWISPYQNAVSSIMHLISAAIIALTYTLAVLIDGRLLSSQGTAAGFATFVLIAMNAALMLAPIWLPRVCQGPVVVMDEKKLARSDSEILVVEDEVASPKGESRLMSPSALFKGWLPPKSPTENWRPPSATAAGRQRPGPFRNTQGIIANRPKLSLPPKSSTQHSEVWIDYEDDDSDEFTADRR